MPVVSPRRLWAASLLSIWLCLVLPGRVALAETYTFAGGHSTVTVSWSHAGLSRHSARIVGADGTLAFDPASPESGHVEVRIEAARISTGVTGLDRLLRTSDYFDVSMHPVITFKSTDVQATGERTGEVTGDLTIRGITRPVTLAVTWNFSGEHPLGLINPSFSGKYVSGFSAKARLMRSEWGLGSGVPLISDEIDIAIEVEAVRR